MTHENVPAICLCGPRECLHPSNLRPGVTCKVQASKADLLALREERDRLLKENETLKNNHARTGEASTATDGAATAFTNRKV